MPAHTDPETNMHTHTHTHTHTHGHCSWFALQPLPVKAIWKVAGEEVCSSQHHDRLQGGRSHPACVSEGRVKRQRGWGERAVCLDVSRGNTLAGSIATVNRDGPIKRTAHTKGSL